MKIRWTLLAAAAVCLRAQPPAAPQFEVASLKPSVDMSGGATIKRMPGDRGYFGSSEPLLGYMMVAYQVRASQVSGPDWVSVDRFDLDAKAEKPSTPEELHLMLQHLLEERFHLKIRREIKEQQGYVLTVDKGGPKMTVHPPGDLSLTPIPGGSGMHKGVNVTMPYLAFFLSNELDTTVVDRTGLDGHYDFEAEWNSSRGDWNSPTAPAPADPGVAAAPVGSSIISALQRSLGLRLEAAKVPAERLVIDHVEKLTGN